MKRERKTNFPFLTRSLPKKMVPCIFPFTENPLLQVLDFFKLLTTEIQDQQHINCN